MYEFTIRFIAWLILSAIPLVMILIPARRLRKMGNDTPHRKASIASAVVGGALSLIFLVVVCATPVRPQTAQDVSAQPSAAAVSSGDASTTGSGGDAAAAVAATNPDTTAASPDAAATSAETDRGAPAASAATEPAETSAPQASGTLQVHYIDVGQGDSEFIELPDGKTLLIDAGPTDAGQSVVSLVKSLGYSRIDYVLASHPHADHIGGMVSVLSSFEVGQVWAPHVSNNTLTFERFLDAVSNKGLSIETACAGKQICSGDGYSVDIYSPAADCSADDLNDWSAVTEITYGSTSFLFPGDASASVVSSLGVGHVDVLKVAHHGSKKGTTKRLVASLSPEYAIISVGADNDYGHPTQAALDALSDVTLFRTDQNGTVTATSDGSNVSVSSER